MCFLIKPRKRSSAGAWNPSSAGLAGASRNAVASRESMLRVNGMLLMERPPFSIAAAGVSQIRNFYQAAWRGQLIPVAAKIFFAASDARLDASFFAASGDALAAVAAAS